MVDRAFFGADLVDLQFGQGVPDSRTRRKCMYLKIKGIHKEPARE